jgi:AcrR family transcriptional regulator
MVDLTTAIGINSPSLYAAFGNKENLFKAVLERYDARRKSFMESVLAAPTALDVARTFLHGIVDLAADTGGKTPPGCLYMQSGQSCSDAHISDEVNKHRAEKEAMLCERFEQARRAGDLPAATDPATLARYLTAMGNGMAVQASCGASAPELRAVADIALASFSAFINPA